MPKCPNCSAERTLEYCPVCGQRRIHPDELSARRFFHELFEEFASLRVKFRTVQTLRGLLTPGWLTAEYLLQLLFRRQHLPYGAHLIFAFHYVAFMYLLTIGVGVGRRLGVSTDLAASVGYALLTPYLVLALKRVYAESLGVILLKAAALIAVIVLLNGVANFVAIRLTLTLA